MNFDHSINRPKLNLTLGFALATGLILSASCGDLAIDLRDNGAAVSIAASDATIEDSSKVVLSGGLLRSKAVGTATMGCEVTGSDGASSAASSTYPFRINSSVAGSTKVHANAFTAPTFMRIQSFSLLLDKNGDPSSAMRLQFYAASGDLPSGSPLAAAVDQSISSVISDPDSPNVVTFTLASPYEASPGQYAITMRPQGAVSGIDNFAWATSNSTNSCSGFPSYKQSSNDGTTYTDDPVVSYRKSIFTVTADTHASLGSVSWIVNGNGKVNWIMSTFSFSENPSGGTAGTITYEIGVGNDSNTPSYSYSNLSQTAVRALADLTGDYLYVRATLSVSGIGFDRAVLGNGSVTVK